MLGMSIQFGERFDAAHYADETASSALDCVRGPVASLGVRSWSRRRSDIASAIRRSAWAAGNLEPATQAPCEGLQSIIVREGGSRVDEVGVLHRQERVANLLVVTRNVRPRGHGASKRSFGFIERFPPRAKNTPRR